MRTCWMCFATIGERDVAVDDGLFCLCEDCARKEANRIYNKMLRAFEECEDVQKLAFLKYGWDDLAYTLDEERDNG